MTIELMIYILVNCNLTIHFQGIKTYIYLP